MQNVPKLVQQRLRAMTPAVNHPDADVLTAFAERSLPEVERELVLEHMARCGDCRDIVVLASPEIEPVEIAVRLSPSGWTWPVLRWGFVAAGVVAIASFGVVQYQRHFRTPSVAVKQSPNLEVAANEPKKQDLARFADATPAEKRDKIESPAAPAFADSVDNRKMGVDEKENIGKKKAIRAETSAPQPMSPATVGSDRFHGAAVGGPISHGPRLANQWPQQNLANNVTSQVSTVPPPAAFANQQAAPEAPTQSQSLDLEAAVQPPSTAGDAFPAIARAKAAPMPSGAEAATVEPSLKQPAAGLKLRGGAGQLRGYVVDPTGAAVANARITITSAAKGAPATAVTNSAGTWLIAGLPTGSYKAQAEAPGFKATVLDLNYDANQPSMYGFTLNVGNASETVEVSAQNGLVQNGLVQTETASGASSGTNHEVSQVPVKGRSFDMLSTRASVAWSITSSGSLQRSVDQGRTWQTVDVIASGASFTNSASTNGTSVQVMSKTSRATKASQKDAEKAGNQTLGTVTFRAVAAAGSEVWAGGNAGALYHSLDSGNHWTRIAPTSGGMGLTGDIIGVDFPDSQHGRVATSTSEVWHTSDDGQTWQKQ